MVDFYRKTGKEVMQQLNITDQGLNTDDVNNRRNDYGFNELEEKDRQSVIKVFFEQFKDFLVIILIIAAVVSAFLGKIESTLVILVVVIVNAILGAAQHLKAEQALKSLRALSSPTAKVLRDNQKIEIPSREIVVGDILFIEAGDYISADGRILESYSLQANESSLTGEAEGVLKITDVIEAEHVAIGDRKNMVFSGSFATYGRAVVIVTAIGMKTEIGKIASLLESAQEKKTPLQVNLDIFGKRLAIIILAISAFIFGLNILRGTPFVESLMFAVSLAVAAIPEALSSIVTIVLALGTQKMAKENAIIRKLHSVESLGSISIICSDKTGTLTQNKMTVQKVFVDDKVRDYNELDQRTELEKKLILTALLCNDAVTIENKEMGDPTEIALVNLGDLYDLDELDIREKYTRLGEIPFDSDRKLMSTLHEIEGRTVMITKGALDVLIERTISIEKSDGIYSFTEKEKENVKSINYDFSKNGLRVLAFAYKEVDKDKKIELEDEKELIFIGLIAMMDPPRKESKQAVADCMQAGIKPIMITGDHKVTASAIAKQIGILADESGAMNGHELDNLTDEELKSKVEEVFVYARVSPEHKIRIVKAWQEKGNVVAMTGDGVNDAPALKQADIGIAMGITGTEVAKDSAAMVLADDNFSTIIKAIANGRSIYSNIKNAIKFLLSGNTAGILSVLYASIAALPIPFAPVHLLFINLVTDSLPAIAIGLEPHNDSIMEEKPRKMNTPILDKSFGVTVLIEGTLIALSTMTAFHLGLSYGDPLVASTMAFATLCLSRLLHSFNSRSKESVFKIGFFTNKYLLLSVAIGYLLLKIVLIFEPIKDTFEVASLSGEQYAIVYLLSFMPLVVVQVYKLIFKK
ncbi:cation-translocating P-type ATPase [Anaerosacchariphilus polymeriproducens]|uniref:Cation-translocating P-type ATPase n=1 Tax=Anaerosacchariphilus polymeriproducens TaxID=1812858 RepID=A0A371AYG9_9FIRM|nr:cation-translocating P-type ATPase [Anaerosacchariphilus polymeriproducens]RDU24634.1 cation-translocating P-type ATPase [Anaerosacchariphilus polymeriproducens]